MVEVDARSEEGDEESLGAADNSLGRLLTLSDGVFAIAMTLLALDLELPELPGRSDAALRSALADNVSTYLSFLVTFYVVATYWQRHRRLMRTASAVHPRVVTNTLFLLLLVSAMPFFSSLLGHYGGRPTAFALYGGFNAVATSTLLLLGRNVQQYGRPRHPALTPAGRLHRREGIWSLAVFVLCIPAGYVLRDNGPWFLLLLAVPVHRAHPRHWRRRRDRRESPVQV